jgi:alpha-beta hydrolase superfamily lysophospholipase
MDEAGFRDADGIEVGYRRWAPPDPSGIVLVLHGASEHGGRYARLAAALVGDGWAVYAIDHRGHGRTAASTGRGIIGPRGIDGVLDDVEQLRRIAEEEHHGLPVVLFGHSMGSVIALGYVVRSGAGLAGCALSGSPGIAEGLAELAAAVRQAVDGGMAEQTVDMLSPFNQAFEPARTPYDWLSRDPAEVDAYIADPDCGDDLRLTYGFVAEIMIVGVEATAPEGLAAIPDGLPFLLVTGERDPVSGDAAQVRVLEERLRDRGHDVTARYYPDARHEVLNETNRDEVQGDIAAWLRSLSRR